MREADDKGHPANPPPIGPASHLTIVVAHRSGDGVLRESFAGRAYRSIFVRMQVPCCTYACAGRLRVCLGARVVGGTLKHAGGLVRCRGAITKAATGSYPTGVQLGGGAYSGNATSTPAPAPALAPAPAPVLAAAPAPNLAPRPVPESAPAVAAANATVLGGFGRAAPPQPAVQQAPAVAPAVAAVPLVPPVAAPPVVPPAAPPVVPPAAPPVLPPAEPPVVPPAAPPVLPPAVSPVLPPAVSPVLPPAAPPVAPAVAVPPAVPPAPLALHGASLPTLPAAPPPAAPATPPVAPAAPPVVPAAQPAATQAPAAAAPTAANPGMDFASAPFPSVHRLAVPGSTCFNPSCSTSSASIGLCQAYNGCNKFFMVNVHCVLIWFCYVCRAAVHVRWQHPCSCSHQRHCRHALQPAQMCPCALEVQGKLLLRQAKPCFPDPVGKSAPRSTPPLPSMARMEDA